MREVVRGLQDAGREKDADRLRAAGLIATCNVCRAGKWQNKVKIEQLLAEAVIDRKEGEVEVVASGAQQSIADPLRSRSLKATDDVSRDESLAVTIDSPSKEHQ